MRIKVANNQPFQSLTNNLSFYAAQEATLHYSADGVNYTAYPKPVPAGETAVVACKGGMFFKITGITDAATVLL